MTRYAEVTNSSKYPYSAIVSIYVTFSNGSESRGTGAVVGQNDVLTSAHLVDPKGRHKVTSIEIIPGYDDGDEPFGSYTASHWRYNVVDKDNSGFLTAKQVARDYAILTVESPDLVGDVTGWFGIKSNAASSGSSIYLESAGYPGGLQKSFYDVDMYRTWGNESFNGQVIEHKIENETGISWRGGSGSPFWTGGKGDPRVVAIFSTTHDATYISNKVFDTLSEWMRENDEQFLYGTKKNDRLTGGFKDDQLVGRGGDDILVGGKGGDALFGKSGHDRIRGGVGADDLVGGSGNDVLRGGSGKDGLWGGRGADTIDGGPGVDFAKGGRGADTFRFDRHDGRGNIIDDFDPGRDEIAIGSGAQRFSDVDLVRKGADTLLRFADVSVLLEDVRPFELDKGDFNFV
jgi:Ca2+-binding RTX toxin-like protein